MVKRLLLLTIILLLSQITVGFSQITIGTIDPGPYTPGSSIAATFKIDPIIPNCIAQNNVFSLHLVRPDGSEVPTPIGSYTGFYSTFVNGIIPLGTPAGPGYKLRISSSAPYQTTFISNAFNISPGTTPVIASLDADEQDKISLAPLTFGNCNTDPNVPLTNFWFTNNSSTGKVIVQIINELNPGTTANLTFTSINEAKTFAASLAHYTMIVRAEAPDGTIGTHAYFLVNNLTVTAFTTTSGNTVCYPTGAFEYTVGVSNIDGIGLNFPGNTYLIDWGDETSDEYTFCQIVNNGNKVRHNYNGSSCGLSYTSGTQTHFNAFGVNVNAQSPFCGAVGAPLSTPARVVERPENKFRFTPIACVGDLVTFFNESTPGQRPNTTSLNCLDNNMRYTWYINDVPIAEGLTINQSFSYTFPAKGIYKIRLASTGAGACPADDLTLEICVQDRPIPSFTLSSNLICLSSPTISSNSGASIIDNTCSTTPIYTWTVNPSAGVLFNKNDVNPNFTFPGVGIYDITLSIANGTCAVSTTPQTVVVNSIPTASLPLKAELCALGDKTFDPNNIDTRTTFTGTTVPSATTYTWTVSGTGRYAFTGTSTANSQYPTINFQDYGTYTVKVTHVNNCGTATATEVITFYPSPKAKITASPPAICFNDKINLTGVITDKTPQTTYNWVGAGSFEYPDPANHLEAIYTPTPVERLNNGAANISLIVNTGITGTCSVVQDDITVIIYPNNIGDPLLLRTQRICTGTNAIFDPKSTVAGSTFKWTAVKFSGDVAGFSTTGSGKIDELLTNNSPTQDAVVQYTIIPVANQCDGEAFTFTVTITPKPIITPIANKTICQGNPAAITITSNIPAQFTWTSVASAGITGNTGSLTETARTATAISYTINDALLNNTYEQGTVTYTIKSYSATGCDGTTTTVTVTVDPAVTQADAGDSESICAVSPSNTYTLKGNKPDVGTGKWRLVSTHAVTPVIAVPTDFETRVSGLVVGLPYTFEWAITGDGACDDTRAEVIITVTPIPVITPVATKTICQDNPAAIAIISNLPAQFTWTSIASAGITGNTGSLTATPRTATANSYTINDVLLNNTYEQGTVTYTIKSYSATGCEGNTITVVVNVDPAVTFADAGRPESICNTTSYHLKGSEPHVGTGLWTLVSATGTAGPIVAIPHITTPINFETGVTGLEPGGVYVFKWTITGTGECAATSATVTITVNMPTIPGTTTTSDALVCQNINSGTITLGGQTGSVLSWQSSTNGVDWINLPGSNTDLTYVFKDLTRTTQFRAVVQNAGCTPENSAPTTVTVAPATTIPDAGTDQTLCNETSVSLKGTQVKLGETGKWTMVSGDANAEITAETNHETTVIKLNPNVTYVFRWTITGNNPCDPLYKDVTVHNNAPIALNSITTSSVVCNGKEITINGSVPTGGDEGHYNYVWERKIDAAAWVIIPNETGEDLTITLTTTGTVSFRRTVTSGSCTATSTEFPITVQPPIRNNSISADQTICSGLTPALIVGTLPTGGNEAPIYQWQSSPNGTTWTNIPGVAQNYQPPILTETTYYRRIVNSGECTGALQNESNPVEVTVTPNAKAEFTWGTIDQGCVPYTLPIQVVTYADRNDTYSWFADGVPLPSTGSAFPGYTIGTSGKFVTIKLVVTSSRNCAPDEFSHTFSTNQAVPPSFDQSAMEGCGPLSVNFTNTSNLTAGATFKWDFGNGQTSTAISPTGIIFDQDPTGKDKTYNVTLTSITSCGENSIPSTVFVKAKPIAVFSPSKIEGCSPMLVNFSNTSPGGTNEYFYDFGDGSDIVPKTDKSPVSHTYNTLKTQIFTVTMTAVNECGTHSKSYDITVYPQNMTPELVPNKTRGCAPFTVDFDNNSIGASHFYFDFGDGGERNTSTAGKEQYTFTKPGTYTVKMTAYNSCSEMTEEETIIVLAQPLPAFHAEETLGCADLPVQFRNTTQGGITYLWDFGDGSTSDEAEPLHIYKGDQEYYTVTLTATNSLGCSDKVIKNQYIHIVPPPVAAFNVNPSTLISIPDYTFKFEDESTNTPTIWEWDFGDGVGSSALKNPSYTYLDTGTFKVTLKVQNQHGCFTTTFKNVTIKGVPGYLFVPNSFIPGSPRPELRLFSAKGSGIQTWQFSVFNKWGQILWESTKLEEGRPMEGWDGTFKGEQMPQGVYYWKIDVQMVNGSEWKGMTYDKSAPKRTGAIHLIR